MLAVDYVRVAFDRISKLQGIGHAARTVDPAICRSVLRQLDEFVGHGHASIVVGTEREHFDERHGRDRVFVVIAGSTGRITRVAHDDWTRSLRRRRSLGNEFDGRDHAPDRRDVER